MTYVYIDLREMVFESSIDLDTHRRMNKYINKQTAHINAQSYLVNV